MCYFISVGTWVVSGRFTCVSVSVSVLVSAFNVQVDNVLPSSCANRKTAVLEREWCHFPPCAFHPSDRFSLRRDPLAPLAVIRFSSLVFFSPTTRATWNLT
ncbi:hypothetical protein QBC35DRAFT_493940 [Podospora australis]|uniref:Secreted protein n=1 Tax=Podospora australis TaxID=1536484 RepID=A0AAN7AKV7_9PEZI|nr:hypothetical protein QBC35DRAFT_493940 [Podospora australis]